MQYTKAAIFFFPVQTECPMRNKHKKAKKTNDVLYESHSSYFIHRLLRDLLFRVCISSHHLNTFYTDEPTSEMNTTLLVCFVSMCLPSAMNKTAVFTSCAGVGWQKKGTKIKDRKKVTHRNKLNSCENQPRVCWNSLLT